MKKGLYLVISLLMLLNFTSCRESQVNVEKIQIDFDTSTEFDSNIKSQSGYTFVSENQNFSMYVNGESAQIKIVDKNSNKEWFSNPQNADGTFVDNTVQASQVKIEYYDSSANSHTMYSYGDSVEYGQYNFEKIDNGIRINYKIGKQEEIKLTPIALTESRFKEIISKCDPNDTYKITDLYTYYTMDSLKEDEKENFIKRYPIIKDNNIYVLQDAGEFQTKRASDLFKEIGYTTDDLVKDNNLVEDYKLPEQDYVLLSVEYSLDNSGFTVNIPNKSVTYPDNLTLTSIDLLPYFGATTTNEQGYIFVPDGSGSIINFNNGKTQYGKYTQRIYGENLSLIYKYEGFEERNIHLPVFGMKHQDGGFIAVVESGSEVGTISAEVSGITDEYNKVNTAFTYTEHINQKLFLMNQAEVFAKKTLSTDIKVKYMLLKPENSDYVGMAQKYREYLIENETLAKDNQEDKKASWLIQLLGSTEYKTSKFGVPITTDMDLTSFDDAKKILEELDKLNVSDLNVNYLYCLNNGYQNSINDKVKFVGKLGGKGDFKDLQEYCNEKNINIYPDVDLMYTSKNTMFDSFTTYFDAAKDILNSFSYKYEFDLVTNYNEKQNRKYILNADKLEKTSEKFIKDFAKINNSLSVGGLGTDLISDFNTYSQTGREEYAQTINNIFDNMKQNDLKIMAKGTNAYNLKYVSFISDVPLSSSGFYIEDAEVPFYQITLHGSKTYYSQPVNEQSDTQQYMLKCIETGTIPMFKLMYQENIILKEVEFNGFSLNYSTWTEFISEKYEKYYNYFGNVINQEIITHTKLGENTYKTEYSNGTVAYVNYGEIVVEFDGVQIPANDCVIKYA